MKTSTDSMNVAKETTKKTIGMWTAEEIHDNLHAQGVFDMPYLQMMAKVTLRTLPERGYVDLSKHVIMKRSAGQNKRWKSLYWCTLRRYEEEYWTSSRDLDWSKISEITHGVKVCNTKKAKSHLRKASNKRIFIRERIVRHLVSHGCRFYEKAGTRTIVGEEQSLTTQEILFPVKSLDRIEKRIMRDMQRIGTEIATGKFNDQECCDPLLDYRFARNLSQVIKPADSNQQVQQQKEEEELKVLNEMELIEETLPLLISKEEKESSEEEASVGSWNLLQDEGEDDTDGVDINPSNGVDGLDFTQDNVEEMLEEIPLSPEEIAEDPISANGLTPELVFCETENQGDAEQAKKSMKRKTKKGAHSTDISETPRRRPMSRRVTPPKKDFPFLPILEDDEDTDGTPLKQKSFSTASLPSPKMNIFDLIRHSTRNTSSLLDDDDEEDLDLAGPPKRRLFQTDGFKEHVSGDEENAIHSSEEYIVYQQRRKLVGDITARIMAMENRCRILAMDHRRYDRRIKHLKQLRSLNQRTFLKEGQALDPFSDDASGAKVPMPCPSTTASCSVAGKKRKRDHSSASRSLVIELE